VLTLLPRLVQALLVRALSPQNGVASPKAWPLDPRVSLAWVPVQTLKFLGALLSS
jgi:hypothetical protein